MLKEEARLGTSNWKNLFSPRNAIWDNRLKRYQSNCPDGRSGNSDAPMVNTNDSTDATGALATINGAATTGNANACMGGWFDFKARMSED